MLWFSLFMQMHKFECFFIESALDNTIFFRNKNSTGFLFSKPVCLDNFTQGTYAPKICSHVHVTAID